MRSFSPETMKAHRARWFVWAGGERLPHTATMRGLWGWDVECSCGWSTRTGGATRRSVEYDLWSHRFHAQADAQEAQEPYRCPECDTYSGSFDEADGEIVHSTCGRAGTPASFTRGTPEYEEAAQS